MTDHGVSDRDMPTFPWSTQPEAGALDALLSGRAKPEVIPAELRPVAEVLVALQAPPDHREVAGWEAALTVYREVAGLDTQTVGLLLGRSPGAIRIAAHRGLQRLASLLAESGVTL